MRQLASFLFCAVALTAGAAEAWRWKDANGTVHYSDMPVPGAERIVLPGAPAPGQGNAAAPVTYPQLAAPSSNPERQAAARYTQCSISQPGNDASFPFTDAVIAGVTTDPPLQTGHRVQVFLNGSAVTDWPTDQYQHSLGTLYRGSYTLSMRVVDAVGRPLCTSPSITFHVRQPSVLSPARKPPPRR